MKPDMALVQCDVCDWKQEAPAEQAEELITFWLNKLCPKCHNCRIITDSEYRFWKFLKIVSAIDEFFGKIFGIRKRRVTIDTSPTRKGDEPSIEIEDDEGE